jgi:adenosine deaminase
LQAHALINNNAELLPLGFALPLNHHWYLTQRPGEKGYIISWFTGVNIRTIPIATMDPLSVSASIAGLVTLADGVFRKTYQYAKGVNDAKQEVQDLSKKVRDLAGILHNLSITVSALDDHTFDPSLRMHHINSCRQSLMQLDAALSKAQNDFDAPSKLKSIQRRLKWPLSTAKTKQIIEDIGRHQETISLALSADSMSAILQCLSRHHTLARKVDGIGLDIKRALTINTRIEMNSKRQAVLDFFAPVNPQYNFEMSLRLRHPLTGLWLTEGSIFQSWLHSNDEGDPKSARLWLSGIPGAGKTVLAGSIIEEALREMHENDATAFFFCDYKSAQSLVPTNILGTIAAQLAKQDDKAFDNLQEYYKELHPARHFSKTPTTHGLNKVLQSMVEHFNRVFIIVDGLDECREEIDIVVEELHYLAISNLPIKFALLSRDEQIIRMRLEDNFSHIEIAAYREDLQLYVAAEIEARVQARKLRIKSMSFKDEVIEAIVNKSEGM